MKQNINQLKKEINLDVIEVHCFKIKPSSVSWNLYFKKMFKLNKMEVILKND